MVSRVPQNGFVGRNHREGVVSRFGTPAQTYRAGTSARLEQYTGPLI
jgi:hypothetical protein